ncbi:MAG: FAD-dependent oxidoreductase [Treponema sp.]|nr:FAD-dependent oxidoreductase [Treponema sp.]
MPGLDADLIIIGAGPAGLTASQYGARANLKVLVIEQFNPGGQALLIDTLENYPGNVRLLDDAGKVIAPPKTGYEFVMDMHYQAESFGAAFITVSVISLKKENNIFYLSLSDGKTLASAAVILATGAKPRLLNIPGENEFKGKGVSYCATCDGNFFKGKKIFVVGGGDAACDEGQYLSRLSNKIVLIHRRGSLRAQKALAERILKNPGIEVRFNTVLKEIRGGGANAVKKVKSVILEDVNSGRVYEEETDAVFIFAGTVPQVSLVSDNALKVNLDEDGYIITDHKMATNIAGLYAAGDVRSGAFRQVVTAASDGAVAAHSASEYIDGI